MTNNTVDKARAKRLKDNFNLSPEEWDKISLYQQGLCFFCGKKQKSGKRLATDHSHASGKIRGLLCSQCNRLLGRMESTFGPAILTALQNVLTYLKDPPASRALGRDVFGYAGRCGTKKQRIFLRREANRLAKIKRDTLQTSTGERNG